MCPLVVSMQSPNDDACNRRQSSAGSHDEVAGAPKSAEKLNKHMQIKDVYTYIHVYTHIHMFIIYFIVAL